MDGRVKPLAAIGGSIGGAAAAIAWLHSIGALPADFIYWSIVAVLIIMGSYLVSWGATQAYKHFYLDPPWNSTEKRKRIRASSMLWAALPSGSSTAGVYAALDPPIWYWFIVPWIVVLLAVTSAPLWSYVFERLIPRLKTVTEKDHVQ